MKSPKELSGKEAINLALKVQWMGKSVQVFGWSRAHGDELRMNVGVVTKVWFQPDSESIGICLDGKLPLTSLIIVFKIKIIK
jgi:hypothetical protein